ncbi:MAG TPA: peptide deformylase, partial [Luteitalea sp.]|nr:peptide deformylase [Luteitalea sp.]
MAIRPIRLFGDPVLRTAADPVTDFDKQLRNLVKDLQQTLDDAQGAGLAAPQIGVGMRVFAYAVDDERGYLVNPSLDFPDDEEQDGEEGCLSFPGIYYDVKRRLNTVARGFTDRGDPIQI